MKTYLRIFLATAAAFLLTSLAVAPFPPAAWVPMIFPALVGVMVLFFLGERRASWKANFLRVGLVYAGLAIFALLLFALNGVPFPSENETLGRLYGGSTAFLLMSSFAGAPLLWITCLVFLFLRKK